MKRVIVAVALGIAAAPRAQAAPLQWSLYGVQFSDGATASGSFDFDATTTTYSNIDITTTAGAAFKGATYTALAPGYGQSAKGAYFVTGTLTDYTGAPLLELDPLYALTDLGGAIPIPPFSSPEYTCLDATCQSANPLRLINKGYVTSIPLGQAAVPEPASLAILGAGVIGLAAARRRRACRVA